MNLLKALATISSMTLFPRIFGFVRDFVIARVFGAGMLTDAFFVAFKLPNLLRRLFAEGAFSQAFVPILGEYKNSAAKLKPSGLLIMWRPCFFWQRLSLRCLGCWLHRPRLHLGTRFCQGCREIRADRRADAYHFSLHSVHVLGGALRGRA